MGSNEFNCKECHGRGMKLSVNGDYQVEAAGGKMVRVFTWGVVETENGNNSYRSGVIKRRKGGEEDGRGHDVSRP